MKRKVTILCDKKLYLDGIDICEFAENMLNTIFTLFEKVTNNAIKKNKKPFFPSKNHRF